MVFVAPPYNLDGDERKNNNAAQINNSVPSGETHTSTVAIPRYNIFYSCLRDELRGSRHMVTKMDGAIVMIHSRSCPDVWQER